MLLIITPYYSISFKKAIKTPKSWLTMEMQSMYSYKTSWKELKQCPLKVLKFFIQIELS